MISSYTGRNDATVYDHPMTITLSNIVFDLRSLESVIFPEKEMNEVDAEFLTLPWSGMFCLRMYILQLNRSGSLEKNYGARVAFRV